MPRDDTFSSLGKMQHAFETTNLNHASRSLNAIISQLCIGTPNCYNDSAVLGSLKDKLAKTRQAWRDKLESVLQGGKQREEILEQLTEVLLLADVGIPTTERIVSDLRDKIKKDDPFPAVQTLLKEEIIGILAKPIAGFVEGRPVTVIMLVGVNGGGKTTSLAKLAYSSKKEGKQVLMVAADTFRAAAQEQLSLWGKKLNIPVIKGQYGSDPASVVYDAVQSFKSHGFQTLLVDTAGRIHTNTNLMNELEKIRRIISREIAGAPHEILLVLDSTIGQNALVQAREFLKFSGITGIFLTKLDGTAKGGSIISIIDELKLPVKFIGVGESEEDMLSFSPEEFADALLL
jgi:fused signal recognition particle receptor